MSLYKQKQSKDGVWWLSLYDENGKRVRRSTGTTDEEEALLIHDEVERNIRLTRFGLAQPKQAAPPEMQLSAFAEEYLNFLSAHYRPKTAEMARCAINTFREFIPRDPYLIDITVGDVESWKTWVLQSPRISPAGNKLPPRTVGTLDIYFRSLRAAWNRAIRWKHATDNPFSEAEKPRPLDDDDERVRFFSDEELKVLFEETRKEPRWHRMVQFYLYTGMRRQEVAHLEWKEMDLKKREIAVVGSKKMKVGGKTAFHRSKTGKRRIVPVSPKLFTLVKELAEERESEPALKKCSLVFPAMNRGKCLGRIYKKESITRKFSRTIVRSGLTSSLTLHSLRHTFASNLVQRGKSLYEVGVLLGHGSAQVTQIYAHLTPSSLATVVEDLDFDL